MPASTPGDRAPLLHRLLRLLDRLEAILAGLSLFLILGLTLAQIVARNLFDTGLPGADALIRELVLYVMFLGAALATSRHHHIRIDLVSHLHDGRLALLLFRPLQFIGGGICLILAWAALRFWLDEHQYAAPHELWLAWLNLILPIGFALIALHFLLGALLGPPRGSTP